MSEWPLHAHAALLPVLQGRSYTAQQLQEMLEWCLDNSIHLISDEVTSSSTGCQMRASRCVLQSHNVHSTTGNHSSVEPTANVEWFLVMRSGS